MLQHKASLTKLGEYKKLKKNSPLKGKNATTEING